MLPDPKAGYGPDDFPGLRVDDGHGVQFSHGDQQIALAKMRQSVGEAAIKNGQGVGVKNVALPAHEIENRDVIGVGKAIVNRQLGKYLAVCIHVDDQIITDEFSGG